MSIQRKQKICKTCKTKQFIFSRGNCLNCDKTLNKDSYEIKRSSSALSSPKPTKVSQIKPKQATKKKKPIKPISEKEKLRLKEYRRVRNIYFSKNPVCEFPGCDSIEVTLHHKRGRIGGLLTNTKYFCSLCATHHTWVENNPAQAILMGLSESRLSK